MAIGNTRLRAARKAPEASSAEFVYLGVERVRGSADKNSAIVADAQFASGIDH
jgi:hypothetical protein